MIVEKDMSEDDIKVNYKRYLKSLIAINVHPANTLSRILTFYCEVQVLALVLRISNVITLLSIIYGKKNIQNEILNYGNGTFTGTFST